MKQIILLFACLFALQGLAKADDDRANYSRSTTSKSSGIYPKVFP